MLTRVNPFSGISAGTQKATSGVVQFSNSNGVSFGLSNNTLTASVSVPPGLELSAGSQTGNSGTIKFADSNGVTFGMAGQSQITATVATNYQSQGPYLTTAMASNASSNFVQAGANFHGTNASGTIGSNDVSISIGNYITTADLSQNSSLYVQASAAFHGTNVSGTINSNNLSISVGPYITTQTNQSAIKGFGASNTGNTSGNTGISSGIDWVLAGTNNITISESTTAGGPNTLWVSGPTGGSVAASGGTQTAGMISFVNSNGVTFGMSTGALTGTLTASVAAGGAFSAGVSTGGNTLGNTGITGTQVVFAGGNNITLSQVTDAGGATITISGPNAGGAQTGISGIVASNTTYTSGTVIFTGVGGGITVSSNTNQRIDLSVGAYITTADLSQNSSLYVQASAAFHGTNASGTINSNNISVSVGNYITTADLSANSSNYARNWKLTGNTAGTTSSAIGTDLWIAGGNNITISGNSNSITISGANAGGAQTGISGIAGSNTTYTSGTVIFTGVGGGITVSSNTNQRIDLSVGPYITTARASTDAIGLNTAQTNVTWTVNSSGLSLNAAGYAGTVTGVTGGSLTVNSSGVSLNLPAYLTTADLSANSSNYFRNWKLTGNTAGTTSSLQGTDLWLSGGNSITVSGNSNTIVFSVGAYITTADLSQNSSKYAGTNGAITGGSITVNTSGVSVNLPAYLTTADLSANSSNYFRNWKLTGNTAGTTSSQQGTDFWLAGGANITVSGNSNSITIVGGAGGGFSAGVSTGGNTSGNTGVTGTRLVLVGNNNITLSQATDTAGATVTFSGATVAGQPVNFSAGATSNNLGSVVFSNSNLVSFGLTGSTITGSVPGTSQLTYTGWASISTNGSTISIGASTTAQFYAVGNTFGTTSGTGGIDSMSLRGSGAVSVAASSSGWVVSAPVQSNDTGNIYAVGNTFGTSSGTYDNRTISISGAGGASIAASNSGWVISAPNAPYVGWLEPFPMTNTAGLAAVAGSWYFAPFDAPGSMSGGRINFLEINTSTAGLFLDAGATAYNSSLTGGLQQSYTFSKAAALYQQGTGTNSTRLESIWSNSFSFGWSKSLSISTNNATNIAVSVAHSISYISEIGSNGSYTLNQFASALSSTIANSSGNSTALSACANSIRNMLSNSVIFPIGFNTTISAGAYWLAFAWSSTRATASTGALISAADFSLLSEVGISRLLLEASWRNWGSTNTTARSHIMPYGVFTGGANMAPPTTLAFSSDLSSLASAWVPYFNFQLQGITK